MYDDEFKILGLNYDKINISEERDFSNLESYDIYYIAGGNTYYILDRLRKAWLEKILVNEIKNDKLYIWVSAWSIIVWPNIDIAWIWADWDENDINLDDLNWFNVISFSIFPHYLDRNSSEIEEFRLNNPYFEVITITDKQAIFVTDKETILIS